MPPSPSRGSECVGSQALIIALGHGPAAATARHDARQAVTDRQLSAGITVGQTLWKANIIDRTNSAAGVGQIGQSGSSQTRGPFSAQAQSKPKFGSIRVVSLSRPVRMLALLCMRPTASSVGKLRPAGLVLGPGSTRCGSQGACSPGPTRTAR